MRGLIGAKLRAVCNWPGNEAPVETVAGYAFLARPKVAVVAARRGASDLSLGKAARRWQEANGMTPPGAGWMAQTAAAWLASLDSGSRREGACSRGCGENTTGRRVVAQSSGASG